MKQQSNRNLPKPRPHTFTTRRNGINLVIPDHAQRRLARRGGRLGSIIHCMACLANEPPGPVAIVSTLSVVPVVQVQRGQAVLKTVLAHDQPLKPGTRLMEVYL